MWYYFTDAVSYRNKIGNIWPMPFLWHLFIYVLNSLRIFKIPDKVAPSQIVYGWHGTGASREWGDRKYDYSVDNQHLPLHLF